MNTREIKIEANNEVNTALLKAYLELNQICKNPNRFRMSIPANPELDSDLIIYNGLKSAEDEIARLKKLIFELYKCSFLVK